MEKWGDYSGGPNVIRTVLTTEGRGEVGKSVRQGDVTYGHIAEVS